MGAPIISLQNVSLTLKGNAGNVNIIKNISLDINKGESIGLIGPSGSGKSSLLMLAGGLEKPSSGEIKILDQLITGLSEDRLSKLRQNNIGVVFQSFHLLPRLSALDNVMMPLEILGSKDAKERALKSLDEVGLSKRTGHVPHQLSGGEKQRVAIARAMVKNPSILFADEPTGNLDQSSTDNILELLLRINQQTKTTLVVVTHDQQLAAQSDMVFELQEGKLKC